MRMLLLMLALTMDLTMEQILYRYDKIAMFSYDTNNNLSQVPGEERKQVENLTSSDHCWPKTGAIITGCHINRVSLVNNTSCLLLAEGCKGHQN